MEFLIKAAQLLLSLSILIVLHELGHFIPAKWFKTRVEKFYLFFDAGFSLFKIKKGETEYGIGWLPLGGYVKIAGMIDESLDNEQLNAEPQPWEFRSKPAWQRLIIMIGGVVVNLVLGFFIYMMILFAWGQDYVSPGNVYHGFDASPVMEKIGFKDGDQILKIDGEVPMDVLDVNRQIMIFGVSNIEVQHLDGTIETIQLPKDTDMDLFQAEETAFSPRILQPSIDTVIKDNPAEKAGILKGDVPLAVNGEYRTYWSDLTQLIQSNKDAEIAITVLRGADTLTLNVKTDEHGKIGIAPHAEPEDVYQVDHKDYGFFESLGKGFGYGYNTLYGYVAQFKFVFTAKGSTGIGGFGAIGKMFPSTWDWQLFWERTAMISIILAFMNILPIPALDGGHVLFLIYEIISGKAPSDKFLTRAQIVGMIILFGLLIYANGLDIYRWIVGE